MNIIFSVDPWFLGHKYVWWLLGPCFLRIASKNVLQEALFNMHLQSCKDRFRFFNFQEKDKLPSHAPEHNTSFEAHTHKHFWLYMYFKWFLSAKENCKERANPEKRNTNQVFLFPKTFLRNFDRTQCTGKPTLCQITESVACSTLLEWDPFEWSETAESSWIIFVHINYLKSNLMLSLHQAPDLSQKEQEP